MDKGQITQYVDVAQLVLYAFWIFFAGLIYYLVRENHREGYPLDHDSGGRLEGWPPVPSPKTYRLADGSEVQVPRPDDRQPPLNAEPLYGVNGAPLTPTGDPLAAGVGPGAYALRMDVVDLDHHGDPKIRPLSHLPGHGVSAKDPDPRGMTVLDGDGDPAGTVVDLWMDVGEMLFRYLEIEVAQADGGTRRVLAPMTFARVGRDAVQIHALMAPQFAAAPGHRHADRLTLLEEERIAAYYGGGLLYAKPDRADPLV
jgi:photosynthetic reaction center H subunit